MAFLARYAGASPGEFAEMDMREVTGLTRAVGKLLKSESKERVQLAGLRLGL